MLCSQPLQSVQMEGHRLCSHVSSPCKSPYCGVFGLLIPDSCLTLGVRGVGTAKAKKVRSPPSSKLLGTHRCKRTRSMQYKSIMMARLPKVQRVLDPHSERLSGVRVFAWGPDPGWQLVQRSLGSWGVGRGPRLAVSIATRLATLIVPHRSPLFSV